MINLEPEGRSVAEAAQDATIHRASHHARWVISGLAAGMATFVVTALLVSDNHAGSDVAAVPASTARKPTTERPLAAVAIVTEVKAAPAATVHPMPANDNDVIADEATSDRSEQDGAERRQPSAGARNPTTAGLRASAAQQVTNALVATL